MDIGHSSILYICNVYEASLGAIKLLGSREKITEQVHLLHINNEYYFLGFLSQYRSKREKFYMYCPLIIDDIYLEYLSDLFNIPKENMGLMLSNLDENIHVGDICQNLLDDEQNLRKIKNIDIVCDCNSIQMFKLKDFLDNRANFIEGSSVQSWMKVKNFGTKSGIRNFIESLGDERIKMPKGKIFYHSKDSYGKAVEYIIQKLKREEAAVAKIDQGCGGRGVIIFYKSEVEGMEQLKIKQYVERKLRQPYWKAFHLIVEDLICVQKKKSKKLFFCLMEINERQELQILAIFGMIQDKNFLSVGLQVGKGVISQKNEKQILYASQKIGKLYLEAGFRGFFDVDFIIDDQDGIFITQSNIRKNDGVPVHNFGCSMYGKQYYKDHYVFHFYLQVDNLTKNDFKKICEQTKRNSLSFTKENGGIVFTGINTFQINRVQFIAVGQSKEDVFQKIEKLKKICENLK